LIVLTLLRVVGGVLRPTGCCAMTREAKMTGTLHRMCK
jgi:hypothetical protein